MANDDPLAQRIDQVRSAIAEAIARRGPGPDVSLIAVSKHHPVAAIRRAYALGLRDFGENYAQEFAAKRNQLASEDCSPRWHFIGGLQSNKVRLVVGAGLLHSVDRPALVTAIAAKAQARGHAQAILVQVHLGGGDHRAGARPDDLPAVFDAIAAADGHVVCRGLMLIPPPGPTQPLFAELRQLADRGAGGRPHIDLRELSMGMSDDFPAAIHEGATMIRIGTAIFGPRPAPGDLKTTL